MKRLSVLLLCALLSTLSLGAAVAESPVTVRVTLDGAPADARIVVTREGYLRGVHYTDVDEVGAATFALAWGNYVFTVDHGGGFTGAAVERLVEVRPPEPVAVEIALARQYDPSEFGYYGADPHAHSAVSVDGATPVRALVAVQRAADLDVLFLSDHNAVGGHAAFLLTARERGLPAVLSEEITAPEWGHFNAYNLEQGGLVPYQRGRTPAQYASDARARGATVFQLNHPASGRFGYLDKADKPGFTLDVFDAWEAANGPWGASNAASLDALIARWNRGERVTAVGVSDDHDWLDLGVEYGTPRTYARVEGEVAAAKWVEAVRNGRAFLTYGPLVYFSSGDAGPGDTLRVTRDEPVRFQVALQSVAPLVRLETLENGRAGFVEVEDVPGGREVTFSFERRFSRSGWIAFRAVAQGERFALTNPIWIEVP